MGEDRAESKLSNDVVPGKFVVQDQNMKMKSREPGKL